MSLIKSSVLTVSDGCFMGKSEDASGPIICKLLASKGCIVVQNAIVSDDRDKIEGILKFWCDNLKVELIITTGGTGFTPRDVTPEATKSIIDKEAFGISTALITESLKVTPMAMLSRLTAGIRGSTLVINFPGSAKACRECMEIIAPVMTHAVQQLRNDRISINQTHDQIQENVKSKVKLQKVALRPRESQFNMISMNEAINIIMKESVGIEETQRVLFKDNDAICGRILAEDIIAQIPLPPFPASVKDGYAVIAEDGDGKRTLISAAATAGTFIKDIVVKSGYCARVSTGAAIPEGANAVVQVEDTKVLSQSEDGEEIDIIIESVPIVGQDIRPIGCDISIDGHPILKNKTHLGPIELGLLAAVGVNEVLVNKMPMIAVLSTGDEITDPGNALPPGAVYDSNRTTLISLLKYQRFQTIDLGIAKDDVNNIFNKLRNGLNLADVIITSGGVSMGEKDLLKQILIEDFGANIHFGRVNLKPGKPTTFATCIFNNKKKLIFALPGNPVSAYVTCHLFVIPALRLLSGGIFDINESNDILEFHRKINVKIEFGKELYKLDARPEFVRAIVSYNNDIPIATLTGNQRSSRLLSAKDANALVLFPQCTDTCKQIKNGSILSAIILE